MQGVTEDSFVFLFVSALSIFSISYSYFSKRSLSSIVSILLIAYGIFAYSSIALFWGSSEEKLHWFKTPPPASVSRIALLALFAVCAVAAWRMRERVIRIVSGRMLPLVAIVIAPLLSTILSQIIFQQRFTEQNYLQIKFAFLFSFFYFVAISSAIIYSTACRRQSNYVFVVTALLLSVVTIVAFYEIAYGIAPVANWVRGRIELRASSTFHNPNWFALAAAVGVFVACKIANEDKPFAATAIFGLCTLAFILSGSRSTIALAAMAMIVLAFALWRSGSIESRVLMIVVRAGLLGCICGLLAGLLAAFLFGGEALAFYCVLLDRIFAWPIHLLLGDEQAWHSMRGRVEADGLSIVDNAYIYLLQENTLTGILLILLMAGVLVFSVRTYARSRTFDNALRLSVATFVITVGMVGQVYWAFPVWPIFAIMLGYVLQPLAEEWFRDAHAAKAQE